GNLAAWADVAGDLGAGVLNLDLVAGGGHDFERAQDRHAGADQGRVGAAEAGERNLVDEAAKDGRADDALILHPATVGSGHEFFQDQIDEIKSHADVQDAGFEEKLGEAGKVGFQKIAQVD